MSQILRRGIKLNQQDYITDAYNYNQTKPMTLCHKYSE